MCCCQYKDLLGVPGKGIHQYRIFGMALADWVLTVIAAWVICKWYRTGFWKTLGWLLVLSVVVHYVFCVDSTVMKKLKKMGKCLTE